jgi:hypothetical protein
MKINYGSRDYSQERVAVLDFAKPLITAWSQHMTLDDYGIPLPYENVFRSPFTSYKPTTMATTTMT